MMVIINSLLKKGLDSIRPFLCLGITKTGVGYALGSMKTLTLSALLLLPLSVMADHWVGTWGTAPQLVETNNNPPSPGLQNNSLRQIVQVSIGGETVRLKLTNEFSTGSTEIKAVELARATTAGSDYAIDESSTVSLTFDGNASVTMAAGAKVTSDAVAFHMSPRENVAITIHYGTASSTSVSGHPGSRTTSYLKSGNTTDFSGATKTDHWYNILALEVMAPDESGAVAILGNSITDGRGSTTNQQNRWADVLSRRLLGNEATANVAVLNMGIGGNCVLSGGLGPTAKDRYTRDLLSQEGVKWIILFEAVNDLGYSQNGVQTANNIIDVYKEIIRAAHAKGIYVFGATITPFKNSSYYSATHENGRKTLNEWIRTTTMLDGVIDFDEVVRNPSDTEALQQQYLFENDWLHLNATGYEAMGNAVDLSLFTTTAPLAPDEEQGGGEEEEVFSSNLPIFYINTEEAINADSKVKGTMKVIDNGEGNRNYSTDTNFNYNGYIGIKWRGNSSLSFAQKKYTIETWDEAGEDLKVSILGMPEESDWVLLAPYNDISLVRDVFAFDMWNEMGHWGPRTRMCEVFVNGEYMGVYAFCEKIKRDKNRVNISKLKKTDIEGRDLTGGYIVRVDAFDEEDETFQSSVPGIQTSQW
jgi:lysophospholipase L1-like esterase